MGSGYEILNRKVTTAITACLLSIDVLPPNTEVEELGREIAGIVFRELKAAP